MLHRRKQKMEKIDMTGIMLVGGMCSGKTTMANKLRKLMHIKGKEAEIFSFATSLKDMIAKHYTPNEEFNKNILYPIYNKGTGNWELRDGRELAKLISEAIKTVDYSWFYREAENSIVRSSHNYFIIDDCRFKEEYEYFKSVFRSIILVHLDIDAETRNKRSLHLYNKEIDTTHVSELLDWIEDSANIVIQDSSEESFAYAWDYIKELIEQSTIIF